MGDPAKNIDDQNSDDNQEVSQEELDKVFSESFNQTGNRDDDLHVADDDSEQAASGDTDPATSDDDSADDADNDSGESEQNNNQNDGQNDGQNDDDKGNEAEPTLKDVLELVNGMENRIESKLSRSVGGQMGRLLDDRFSKLNAVQDVAKDEASQQGKDVPSKDRVAEALKSVKGFEDLKKDFPEYASVLEEGMSLVLDMSGGEKQEVNSDDLVTKVAEKVQDNLKQETQLNEAQVAENARIDEAWPGWMDTINEAPFAKWAQEKLAGPNAAEYQRVFDQGSTRETISVLEEFGRETGAKPGSKEDGGGQQGNGDQQDKREELFGDESNKNNDAQNSAKNRQRRSASRPKSTQQAAQQGKSEQEIFRSTFKERSGG